MELNLKGKSISELVIRMSARKESKTTLKAEHTEALRRINGEISQYHQEICRQIAAGGTTGDSLRDILIQHLSSWDLGGEQKFRDFQDLLKGHTGEFFLIEFTYSHRTRFGGPGSDEGYKALHLVRLGVLTGEELIYLDNSVGITVPVRQYVSSDNLLTSRLHDQKAAIKENIFDHTRHGDPPLLASHILGLEPSFTLGHFAKPDSTLDQVIVGDAAVKEWILKRPGGKGFYKEACDLLSKLELEPMGPNDGPLPKELPPSSAWDELCEVRNP